MAQPFSLSARACKMIMHNETRDSPTYMKTTKVWMGLSWHVSGTWDSSSSHPMQELWQIVHLGIATV
jgi:hypothetical protein